MLVFERTLKIMSLGITKSVKVIKLIIHCRVQKCEKVKKPKKKFSTFIFLVGIGAITNYMKNII